MLKEILEHRGLLYELAIRDIKLRYRRPFFGFFWMLIIPLSTAVIYKILFSDFMRVTTGPYPFFIHLITAMLPWMYLVNSVQGSTASILGSRNMINQISFPKCLLPVSTVVANLINFLPAVIVLLGFLVAYRVRMSGLIILLPAVIVLQTCLIMGLSLLVSCLQVVYRDTEYFVQIALTALFFLTPGVYTLEEVIQRTNPLFVKLYMGNPLVGILSLYRIVFIGNYLQNAPKEITLFNTVFIPLLFSAGAMWVGYYVFRRYEPKFSDYLNV